VAAVRFCSACGEALPSPPPVTCSACGVGHWRNPKPCANAIVVEDEKVLLARRAYAPWQDAWGSPGGFCELGEHPIETVEREVFEETGVRIAVTGYIGVWVDRYADEPSADDEVINVSYYHAQPTREGGGSIDTAEVTEIGWFPWDELPGQLAPPATLEIVLAAAKAALRGEADRLPDRPR
jgi:ADP-ribose pyrophosphatase YjhB (NUDIX family)